MPRAGYVQLLCKHCGEYFRTSQRARNVKCGKCQRYNYVPADPQWEGPGNARDILQSKRQGRPVSCPKCAHVWYSIARKGTPTHCPECKASLRIREEDADTRLDAVRAARLSAPQRPAEEAPRPITPAAPPRPPQGRTEAARTGRKPRQDAAPGSARAIGREGAARLRAERREQERARQRVEREEAQENYSDIGGAWSGMAEGIFSVMRMMGKDVPTMTKRPDLPRPMRYPTPARPPRMNGPVRHPHIPIPINSQAAEYQCHGYNPGNNPCNAAGVETFAGLRFCTVHARAIEMSEP